jgi:hypothetical protein
MHHVRVAFTILEEGAPEPTGSKRIPCHIVFDTSLILQQALLTPVWCHEIALDWHS